MEPKLDRQPNGCVELRLLVDLLVRGVDFLTWKSKQIAKLCQNQQSVSHSANQKSICDYSFFRIIYLNKALQQKQYSTIHHNIVCLMLTSSTLPTAYVLHMSAHKKQHMQPFLREGDSPSNRSWLGSQMFYSDNLSHQDNSYGLYSNSSDDDRRLVQHARPLLPENDRLWKRSRLGSYGSDSNSSDDHMRSSLNPTRPANLSLPDNFSCVTALTDDSKHWLE